MTLVLSLLNDEQCIQISDRRLTYRHGTLTDEENKAIALVTSDARLSVSFSGLATAGRFSTREWILDSLFDLSPPDYKAELIIKRLALKATELFEKNNHIRRLDPATKRLSISFCGYHYGIDPPLAVTAAISNFSFRPDGQILPIASREFITSFTEERRPAQKVPALIQRIGQWTAMERAEELRLLSMLERHASRNAIIREVYNIFMRIAGADLSNGTIGKQLNVVIIPRNPSEMITSDYYSSINKQETYMPDLIVVTSDKNKSVISGLSVKPEDPKSRPISVPRTKPNSRCPCNSGLKYKKCHGRNR
ncbi:SEC-C domain-containing protein [Nitrospirillum pindoramense]|uniref:SEC-C motif-containing protein n=1 Tax=Nitrospirillum amazonense TaxID=28077 RepID=A0A560HHM6_9PROT|nr:SEC-C domain-containing protein [Nitrospirillum amazonense]TWB45491.1 SEC-C motif-containing protein [Nitrospirillum amazonense]